MSWAYFKDFLEGSSVSVARPKNRGDNVVFSKDVPVFGTAASPVQYIVSNGRQFVVDESETQQVNSRIVYFHLVSWESEAVVECQPCLRCAARLYSAGAE